MKGKFETERRTSWGKHRGEKSETLLKQQRLQSEIECFGDPTKTYIAGIQKRGDFLSKDHHDAKEFWEKTLQELRKLSCKLAEISSKADYMATAIDDLQKYSFQ